MIQPIIPDTIPAIPLSRSIPDLVWTREQLVGLRGVRQPRSLESIGFALVPESTPIELEENTFVVVGEKLGEGLQGVVYAVATSPHACVKLCRNERSAKQFRRERLGVRHYNALSVGYPAILGADAYGRWIVKERWYETEDTGERALAVASRILPPHLIHSLHSYVHKFQEAGLCADWMPSNVVFRPGDCATFETSLWPIETHGGWNFTGCFLPVWIPDGVPESMLEGFPPYNWPARRIEAARSAWMTDPAYETWRELYGDFPKLCPDWWVT